jgi:hypothetical protein
MADDPATSAQVRSASPVLELTAKAAGAVAAVSALVGVTYNVVFFMGSKQAWLFYLSVTDNLTATLYALPFVALVAAMMATVLSQKMHGKCILLAPASSVCSRPPSRCSHC